MNQDKIKKERIRMLDIGTIIGERSNKLFRNAY